MGRRDRESKGRRRTRAEETARDAGSPMRPKPRSFRRLAAGLVALSGLAAALYADWRREIPPQVASTYVGRDRCIACHTSQATAFHGSDHDLAMDRATPETVLADFDDATLTHHGMTSRMYRRDGKYMIHTEGPDGAMQDFEIKYVFGVHPLQQYLVEFDRTPDMKPDEVARLQVLRISWDTEAKRWFYLPPPDVDERILPDDPLHWTGMAQRWNTMCADCHSTNLQANYDVSSGRYRTTFSEIDVSCEACHGPGGGHVALAERIGLFWDRRRGKAIASFKKGSSRRQVESCAPCHSRRSAVHPNFQAGKPYYDFFLNQTLDDSIYFADGQVLDEVYVYGSFIQTKMFHKDVRCTDCHDPHTAKLKYKGNKVCTSCHQHPAGKYDTPAHHHHAEGSTGSRCVECHIPETTFMEVDARRDHSFRVPRPDVSVALPLPNACTRCHLDRAELAPSKRNGLKQYRDWVLAARDGDADVAAALHDVDQWCADAFAKWYPDAPRPPEFPGLLLRARARDRHVLPALLERAGDEKLAPIVRATLFQEADMLRSNFATPRDGVAQAFQRLAKRLLHHADPQLRVAAVRSFSNHIMPTGSQPIPANAVDRVVAILSPVVKQLTPLLDDRRRVVRVEAARVLQRIPPPVRPNLLVTEDRQKLELATRELMAQFDLHADRAGSHLAKALLFEAMGRDSDAIASYRTAIRVEPTSAGARSNLAGLLERLAEREEKRAQQIVMQRGPRSEAESVLKGAFDKRRRADMLRREELPLLGRDAKLAPRNAAVQFRYGLALYLAGRPKEAEALLRRAVELAPRAERYVQTLAVYYRDFRQLDKALVWARRLLELDPQNPQYQALVKEVEQLQRQGAQRSGESEEGSDSGAGGTGGDR